MSPRRKSVPTPKRKPASKSATASPAVNGGQQGRPAPAESGGESTAVDEYSRAAMMLATWYGLARANAIHYAPDDAMLVRFAERGLPATLAREVIDAITSLAADRTRLMRRLAPSMLANPQPRTLPPLESDRVVRLARVFACSQAVLGGLIAARAYFTTPHAALGGRRPIDLIHTDPGADMVSRGFPTITTTYLPNVVAGTLPDLVE